MELKTEIYLNQLAQKVLPINDAVVWFSGLSNSEQLDILRGLNFFILQAGAVGKTVKEAISLSELKPTYTPCQILLKVFHDEPLGNHMLRNSLAKVANLPSNERTKTFRLLVALFSVAYENKRKKEGLNPEKYWWHKDLSDENVVKNILSKNFEK